MQPPREGDLIVGIGWSQMVVILCAVFRFLAPPVWDGDSDWID